MQKAYNLQLDFIYKLPVPKIELVKGDIGGNIFNIKLTNQMNAVDLTGQTATVTIRKSDNTSVVYDAPIVSKDTVTFIPDGNALSVTGSVQCTVEIFNGSLRTTSIKFSYKVIESLNTDDDIASFKDYPVLTKLINDVQVLQNNTGEAENTRNASEDIRISNENTRKSNEEARQQAEETRVAEVEAIKEAYDGATKANTSVEVFNSRHDNVNNKDYANLPARLDSYATALNEKANQYDLTTNYATKTMLGNATAGIAGYVSDIPSIPANADKTKFFIITGGTNKGYTAIWNGSVWVVGWLFQSVQQFVSSKEMLIRKYNILPALTLHDGYINATQSNYVSSTSWSYSEPVQVIPNTKLKLNISTNTSFGFVSTMQSCDILGNLTSDLRISDSNSNSEVYIPANVNYVAFSFQKTVTYLNIEITTLSDLKLINGDFLDKDYVAIDGIGKWSNFGNHADTVISYDSTNKAISISTTGGSQYDGMVMVSGSVPTGKKSIVKVDIKGVSGDYSAIRINRATPLSGNNLAIIPEWQTFYINDTDLTSNNAFLSILNMKTNAYSILVRNFYYAMEGTYEYNSLMTEMNIQNQLLSKLDTLTVKTGNFMDLDYSCIGTYGKWSGINNGNVSYDSGQDAVIVSGISQQYAGIAMVAGAVPVGKRVIVKVDIKGISGDYSGIRINRKSPTYGSNVKITNDWQTFYILDDNLDSSLSNLLAIFTMLPNSFSIGIRNFYYAMEGTFIYSEILHEMNGNNVANQSISYFDKNNDSIDCVNIQASLSDFNLPSWIGKSELRITDIEPSINTQGQSYLYQNGSDLELRIVKDPMTIVGCVLASKFTKSIVAKTVSMCHFGDSITYGVGSSTPYVTRLKNLLQADGHTISLQTNLGISGADAESLCGSYKNITPLHHDIATLMIGINDVRRWLEDHNASYAVTGIDAYGFRNWYRSNLLNLISIIKSYSTCANLFLIVPYRAVKSINTDPEQLAGYPLHEIVIQECINAVKNDSSLKLCRADYYVPESATYIPDSMHVNDTGAQMLAQGLRNEITFRV